MFDDLKNALIAGNASAVKEMVTTLLKSGTPAQTILKDALIAGMDQIGDRFRKNEVFIPEVMIAAKAMHSGLDVLQPVLAESGIKPSAKVVVGTIKGDLHDIGKNIVSMMFRGAGFAVCDLGIDVPPQKFINSIRSEKANVLAMSSLLTTSMTFMKDVMDLLKSEGLDAQVKTIVGGAPVTQEFADKIGADGYAEDASSAVNKVRELLGSGV